MALKKDVSAYDPTTDENKTGTVVFGEDFQQLLGPDGENICFCNEQDMNECGGLVIGTTLIGNLKLECKRLCEKSLEEQSRAGCTE